MPKPTISKHSTLVEMKAFVRKHKLNHPSVKLGMKKAEMLSALDKLGHINTEPRPKKTKAPPKAKTPVPKKVTFKTKTPTPPKAKTPTPPKAKTPSPKKEINAYNLNYVLISTLFSESSLIWVDNKYIMKKGLFSATENKKKEIIGYYTDSKLWNKLAYYNIGKGDPPRAGKHETSKYDPLFIDDRKVKYIHKETKEALENVKRNMDESYYQRRYDDYEGFLGYAKFSFDKPDESSLIQDYLDENWRNLGW